MSANERRVIERRTSGDDSANFSGDERQLERVYEDKRNETENPFSGKCHVRMDESLHGADGGWGLDRRVVRFVLLRDHMRPGCRRGLHHPDMGRITGHASSFVSFWYDGGLQTSISGPPAYPGHVACVSSAPMQGTPRAFSGWRRCRYAIRQPRRGKRPRPRHRQIPGSIRKIFILVLPRPGACHGVRPACPASVCCVHGPRLR